MLINQGFSYYYHCQHRRRHRRRRRQYAAYRQSISEAGYSVTRYSLHVVSPSVYLLIP